MTKVLIVDDEPVQLRLTEEVAKRAGFDTITADNGSEALSILRADKTIGALVLDLVMPDLDGMGVLEAMRREDIGVPVIVQTASSSMETIISAMRYGAVDYFVKPVAPERITISLQNAIKLDHLENCVRTERAHRNGTFSTSDIITRSASMIRVITLIKKASKSNIPVLIEGETGVGKELVARAIQGTGDRRSKPFITVNCGAIPENLVESTLFGHVKGAFTGATSNHAGKFEEAHGGTLFLDEVGELPPAIQVKLLRALQEGEIEPVGSSGIKKVNVRLISATNRRLLKLAQSGTFREDLFYRLNVFPIYVPPLRDRREDIAPLTEHFIARFSAEAGRRIHGISENAMNMLMDFNWPGNIRQLENAIFRAVILADNAWLNQPDFPQINARTDGRETLRRTTGEQSTAAVPVHIDDAPLILEKEEIIAPATDRFVTSSGDITSLASLEKELIIFALNRHKGHMSRIARSLGIGRSTLYRKLKEYGLDDSDEKNAA